MLNSKLNYTTKQYERLKREVEFLFGRKIISTKDCEQLQQEIKDFSLTASLGLNTIRRCFNIIKTETALSQYTLDVFSNYCGYENYNHFLSTPSKSKNYQEPLNLSLIETLYRESVDDVDSSIFTKLHLEIFEAILTNPKVFQSVFPKLVHYPVFQEYVLSFHPLIDKLNQEWYMRAIRVFTKRSNIIHLKVFGLAMDFLRLFLNSELEKCKPLVDEMTKLEDQLLVEYPLVVWPQARLFSSAYIYYNYIGNKSLANNYKQKIKHNSFTSHSAGKKTLQQVQENSYDFLMCVCDYLSLAGDYEFVGQLLEDFGASFKNGHSPTSRLYKPYKVIVEILKAEYFFYSGYKQEAKEIMKQVELSNLTFEFKNFYTLRYLLLQMESSKDQSATKFKNLKKQSTTLIKQLGYKRFQKQLNTMLKK